MILIEGPDRTGKTTVAKWLALHLGWPLEHFGIPPGDVKDYHLTGIRRNSWHVVVDRLHWSEYAYGLTYRGKCGYDEAGWRQVEDALIWRRCKVILMMDTREALESRWNGEPFDADSIDLLIGRFWQIYLKNDLYGSNLPVETFNLRELLNDGTPTPALLRIANHARKETA